MEVVGILDGTPDDTLVLLCSVLGGLLSLLALGLLRLLRSLLLSLQSGLLFLCLSGLLCKTFRLSLLFQSAFVLVRMFGLSELLDTLVESQSVINEVSQASSILGLLLAASIWFLRSTWRFWSRFSLSSGTSSSRYSKVLQLSKLYQKL